MEFHHLNIQGLPYDNYHKLDLLSNYLCIDDNVSKFFAVTETHLRPSDSDQLFSIPGYCLFRSDRPDIHGKTRGGGILCYVPQHITAERVELKFRSKGFECLWLQLTVSHRKIIIGTVYRQPDSNSVETKALFNHLREVLLKYPGSDHMIMGDLNIDSSPGSSSPYVKLYSDFVDEFSFEDKFPDFVVAEEWRISGSGSYCTSLRAVWTLRPLPWTTTTCCRGCWTIRNGRISPIPPWLLAKPSTAVRPTPSTNDPQRTIRHLEEQLHTCHATLHSLQSPRSSPAPHRAHPPPPVKTSMTTRVEHVLVESAEEMGDAMVGCVESVLYRVLAVIIHGLRVLAILVGILALFMLFVTAAELVDVGSERTFSTFALLVTVGLWMGLSVTVYALQRIGGPPRGMTTGATHLSTI
ncbi:uncharacterized protein LOC129592853 [Paramacrobiotus metropolitanus]|uniref:uncharacterized protein LOC129592853 n=1 Tax=Paramacrobiotus metropolitanus TaxID=2943436 RepID=UPI0024462174|nr:uncharacterized protein LOC129592853 [Paramacrobiotus metropolitanus]